MPSSGKQYAIAATAIVAAMAIGLLLGRGPGAGAGQPRSDASGAQRARQASAETAAARPDEAALWKLIGDTRRAAGGDTGRQAELLEARVAHLPAAAAQHLVRVYHRLDVRAYTWNLWGAAQTIEDGCSDDCFRDFRAYLISLGPGVYERALANPDSLAAVVKDAEGGDWEDAFAPDDESDPDSDPRGRPFDDDDEDDGRLARRYPRLAARFR
jgi:hypothetical protein